MIIAATPKILTPLTLGSMHLAHRGVILAQAVPPPGKLTDDILPGGMVIAAGLADPAGAEAAARLREAGSHLVAALSARDAPSLAPRLIDAGWEALELDAAGLAPAQLLPILDEAIRRWGPARLAVRLPGSDEQRAFDVSIELLATLNELELGFVHLRHPPAGHAARHRLRSAFRWPIIASGGSAVAQAVELVESRFADAIGFDADAGLPDLLRAGANSRGP